jgi:hypothetical protein
MDLLKFFRRPPPIRDERELADFVDKHAAFLVQKGIYEYSRARAGHYAKVLFAEPGFQDAVEESRWRAYPLGLAMVAEVVDAALDVPQADRLPMLRSLGALVVSIFDRYPVPARLGADAWSGLRGDLIRRLQLIGLHSPKRAMDIPETFAQTYFELMPIHEKLRGRDFWTLRNYLRVTLCNIHDEFTKRGDATALTSALQGQAA